MDKRTLLVIDDDEIFLSTMEDYFKPRGMDVFTASTGKKGLDICSKQLIDVVILDQKLPDVEGHAICESILKNNEKTKIIFSTAFPSFENALKAIEVGAFWYVSKPVNFKELTFAIEKSLKQLDLEKGLEDLNFLKKKEEEDLELVGSSGSKAKTEELIEIASRSDSPVLITGETGTGKTLIAKIIHKKSGKKGPFVSVNCAALPENLVEAELFGYKKGAFTGADNDKKGLLEVAHEGTLLLDEIGEMPLSLQSKLLGVIEEKKCRRIGDVVTRKTAARIIAATNSDIDGNSSKNLFRKDLYYRLNVLRIHLPPLRERVQDIADLAEYFVKDLSAGKIYIIPEEEKLVLSRYFWDGNIRELRNVIERAMIIAEDRAVLPSKILCAQSAQETELFHRSQHKKPLKLEEIEREHILTTLNSNGNNMSKTARDLGISLSTLKRKLKLFCSL
ncbi:sigma-54-dependent Fis family transcriptional regulator [candidate division WOR-3 bacterium]|nr:sigma-54-dependent Fis family transcriptional regulator [candidate division WOR-3 bacterium]